MDAVLAAAAGAALDAALAAPEVLAAPEGLAVPVLANKTCFCKFTILCKNENRRRI